MRRWVMQEDLADRLYSEYMDYKDGVLRLSNDEIFSKCYEIDIKTNIYDIISELVEKMNDETIKALLDCGNILDELYNGWLKRDDNIYSEIKEYLTDEVVKISGKANTERKVF
jgi:hypothetical protein